MTMYGSLVGGVKHDYAEQALSRSYFSARNPTPGTGIASDDTATARSDVLGTMVVYNSADADADEFNLIIPIRLSLRATSINTSGTALTFAFYTDIINRWTSGGTAITPVPHVASGEPNWTAPTSKATIHFGDLVLPSASSEKKIYTREVLTTILAADDTFDMFFGEIPALFTGATGATGHHETSIHLVPPMWIRPGASMIFQHWSPSSTADPDWEFEFWYLDYDQNAG